MCSLFFSSEGCRWQLSLRIFHLKEAASPGVKLPKVVSKHGKPCVTLRWWGAEEKELAAIWNSDRESYLTNHPLWWMDISLRGRSLHFASISEFIILCWKRSLPTATSPSGCCPLFTQSKFTVMGDLRQRFKGSLTRGVQCLLAWQRVASLLPTYGVHPETSLITLAFRPAPQPLGFQFSLGWRSYC